MDMQSLLVIEDEPLIRLELMDILENAGFDVVAVADARTALAAIDGHQHLAGIVTDINLGSDLRGWTIARQARQKFPELAVVYITGDSVSEWDDEGVLSSVVIQKPFADEEIVNAITALTSIEESPLRLISSSR